MNLWLKFLKLKFVEELNNLKELIHIDNTTFGTDNNLTKINNFINENITNQNFYSKQSSSNYLIESSTLTLIKIINDNILRNINITILENNMAVSHWVIKKYEEFCDECGIDKNITFTISNHFSFKTGTLFICGSKSFIKEIIESIEIPYDYYVDEQ